MQVYIRQSWINKAREKRWKKWGGVRQGQWGVCKEEFIMVGVEPLLCKKETEDIKEGKR